MVASASYQPLVDILQSPRSHFERMVDQLISRALTRGEERRRLHVRPAPGGAGAERGRRRRPRARGSGRWAVSMRWW